MTRGWAVRDIHNAETRPNLTAAGNDPGNGCRADSTEFERLSATLDASLACISRIASRWGPGRAAGMIMSGGINTAGGAACPALNPSLTSGSMRKALWLFL